MTRKAEHNVIYRVAFATVVIVLLAGAARYGYGDILPAVFQVIPQPRNVELMAGPGLDAHARLTVRLDGDVSRPVMGPVMSQFPETGHAADGTVTLRIDTGPDVPESSEGYVLTVSDGSAVISARSEPGIFYGCQTLEQLIEDARDTGTPVPACRITDFPALSYRAVHFDVKHHLDSMDYYYDSVDRLARYKLNAIIFEFEDKLRYRRRPLVGAPQAISIDEMAALTKYARARYIEISPLVQGLGHASFILKHEAYAHLREDPDDPWTFCPKDEGTYQLLFDLYRDAIEATPGARYLHIGGDEVGKVGLCHRCKAAAEKDGVFGLNLYWLNRVCDFVKAQGRVPIFWDDMPLKYAGLWQSVRRDTMPRAQSDEAWQKGQPVLDAMVDRFPKGCVYMRWTYNLGRQPGNVRALDWYRSRGLDAMIATAAQNTTALLPQDDRVDIIRSFVGLAAERGIDGMLCTAWDDSSPHIETYWRGWIASGEYSWSPAGRSLDAYERAYLQRAFGPECIGATELYADLYREVAFWKNRVNPGVPDPASPGTWRKKNRVRVENAREKVARHRRLTDELADMHAKARRNRYHIEILAAVNDLQVTPASLLLALDESDVADPGARKEGKKHVRAALDEFDRAWRRLQNVYAKTRFIAYPDSYVPDRGRHFASKREDLTWMILVEEEHHQQVRAWLAATSD